jgi:NAD(P)H-dependent FMN reductase
MNNQLKIIAFAGSLRKDSYNKRILQIVTQKIASMNVNITILDLNDYDFPLFNQDLEAEPGMPLKVRNFKQAIHSANSIIIASPEYNGSITGVLKNAIDWASRKVDPKEETYEAFARKPVGIISASPGYYGGLRGVMHLRDVMMTLGSVVMPENISIPGAHEINDGKIFRLETFAENFINFAKKFL